MSTCESTKPESGDTPRSGVHGTMCWLEIPVTDVSRAQKFYAAVLGWECMPESMPSPVPGIKSVHFFSKDRLNGAFTLMDDGMRVPNHDAPSRPHAMAVLPTIFVPSIEEAVGKAEGLGGKMAVPKTEIGGDMGFFARIIDCEGNMMGIFAEK